MSAEATLSMFVIVDLMPYLPKCTTLLRNKGFNREGKTFPPIFIAEGVDRKPEVG